jgi:hypothetical protein
VARHTYENARIHFGAHHRAACFSIDVSQVRHLDAFGFVCREFVRLSQAYRWLAPAGFYVLSIARHCRDYLRRAGISVEPAGSACVSCHESCDHGFICILLHIFGGSILAAATARRNRVASHSNAILVVVRHAWTLDCSIFILQIET